MTTKDVPGNIFLMDNITKETEEGGGPRKVYAKRTPKGVCSIPECEEPTVGQGYCRHHYYKLLYYGDPEHSGSGRWFAHGDTYQERFWSRVNKDGPIQPHMVTQCWEWLAGRYVEKNGKPSYGVVTHEGRSYPAHRFAWFVHHGKWPAKGKQILHSCHNPVCCNPDHLREGTNQQNIQDRQDSGRQTRGSAVHTAKLTEEIVVGILVDLKNEVPLKDIAERTGVKKQTISHIKAGRRWKHIPRI